MIVLAVAYKRRPRTFYEKVVSLYTLSPRAHCELVVGSVWVSATSSEGVTLHGPRGGDWDLVNVPATAEECAQVLRWARGEQGCGYDWKGVFLSQVLPLSRQDPERWFCSELCVAGLQQIDRCLGLVPHRMSPADLYAYQRSVRPLARGGRDCSD